MEKNDVNQWFCELEIVNVETGEILTKSEFKRNNLRIINKTKNYEIRGKKGIIKHRWECKQHEQTRFEF